MGQKINPTLIRIGIPSKTKNRYTNDKTRLEVDIFDRQDSHIITGFNRYNKELEEIYLIEKYLIEFFNKSGILINDLRIRKNYTSYNIYLDIFQRDCYKRKIIWTSRKTSWRFFNNKDIIFFTNYFQKFITKNVPINWNIRNLNDELKIKEVSNRKNKRLWELDGPKIFKFISKEPGARLLCSYIKEEILSVQRHSIFIRYLFENMNIIVGTSELIGCLISLKGRIDGSDRSKKSVFRKGSVPLHTFDAPINYYFNEVTTRYGVCSIKVWLKYILYIYINKQNVSTTKENEIS